MKRYLLIFTVLLSTSAYAEPFAEVALSARQQYGKLGDGFEKVEGTNIVIERWRAYDVNKMKNPYASIMVGYKWQLKTNFELGLSVRHESSIATSKDRGINDLRLSLRWSGQK